MRLCRTPGTIFWLLTFGLFLVASLPLNAADRLSPSLADRERIARESRQAISFLQDYHYLQKPLISFKTEDIIRDFISDLDYSRMFFTESQIKAFIKRFDSTLQTVYLSRGDLYPAIDIYNNYYRTAQTRLKWVLKRLKGEFDFTTSDRFVPDRTKAAWPASEANADELWEARLTNELLIETLNGRSVAEAKEKLSERYSRSIKLLDEFDTHDLQTAFLTSLCQMYDPHSNYFSNEELEDFSITMSNTLVGIGALLKDENGYCTIQELIPGGPAEQSGLLHAGDKIVEVAQGDEKPVDVVDLKISKVVKMIRGEPGSIVGLTIIPASATDSSMRKKIKLERNEVHLTENLAKARVIEVPNDTNYKTVAIGVIELPSFYGGNQGSSNTTSQDIKELIGKLQGMGIKGLVIDLRRNGGGLLTEAIDMVGLFAPKAPAVQVRDSQGNVKADYASASDVTYTGPLVVLTSRESASASEIVAGALQSLNRAIIVGDKSTHGKGTVQAIFEIDRGLLAQFLKQSPSGGIKITIQKFYLPDGATTQHKGVLSDIVLPGINDYLPIGESSLPHALEWDTIKPAPLTKTQAWDNLSLLDKTAREFLLQQSQERQQSLSEFKYLNEIVNRLKAKQAEKAVSLNYDLRLKEKQLNEAFVIDSEKSRKELARDRYASADVLLDLSWKMKAEHQQQMKNTLLPNGKSRLNEVYDNTYYYAPAGSLEIKEIAAKKLDPAALSAYTDTFASMLDLSPEQMKTVWDHFKQGGEDRERASLNIQDIFKKSLGNSVSKEKLETLPKKFFETALEVNPQLADEHPEFDISLREALRVTSDWVSLRESNVAKPVGEEKDLEPAGAK